MKIYCIYNGQKMILPVNPSEIEIARKVKNETASIISLGNVAIAGNQDLISIKISSILPDKNKYPFIETKDNFVTPNGYITFFKNIIKDKKPFKLTITGTEISFYCLIDSFSYKHVAMDDDYSYELTVTEYKQFSVKTYTLKEDKPTTSTQVAETTRVYDANQFAVGRTVTVNGQLFRDSYGNGGGKVLSNYVGVISIIKKGRKKPYHITTPTGAWLGWVGEDNVK